MCITESIGREHTTTLECGPRLSFSCATQPCWTRISANVPSPGVTEWVRRQSTATISGSNRSSRSIVTNAEQSNGEDKERSTGYPPSRDRNYAEGVYSPPAPQSESREKDRERDSRQPGCLNARGGQGFLRRKQASRTVWSTRRPNFLRWCHSATADSTYHGRCIRTDRRVRARRPRSASCGRPSCTFVQGVKQGTKMIKNLLLRTEVGGFFVQSRLCSLALVLLDTLLHKYIIVTLTLHPSLVFVDF